MSKNQQNRNLKIAGIITEEEYKFSMDLPDDINVLYNVFKKHGKKLYVVGGAVRDVLMDKKPKDFDVVTDALPDDVEKILNAEHISNFPSGKAFGIISAVINGETYEIATFRSDNFDSRTSANRKDFTVDFVGIEGDALRRDLTINALYYDIGEKKIIDLVGGVEDIKNKKVKPVGNAHDRFTEDRLRVLRALRFAHRFGSTLDQDTIDAIINHKELSGVSNERIRDEFIKTLNSSKHPELFLQEFLKLGLAPRTFGNVNLDTKPIPDVSNPIIVLAKLLWKNDVQAISKSMSNFKSPRNEIGAVLFLKNLYDKFKDFDRLVFDPQIDSRWLLALNRAKNLLFVNNVIDKSVIVDWATIMNLDAHLINSFISFEPTYSAKDFPDIKPGQELGNRISTANAKLFIDSL